MKVAAVSLNSLFKSGASSFTLHLAYKAKDWDVLLLNELGKPLPDYDIPLEDIPVKCQYVSDSKAKILENYDLVLFTAPRWNGKYDFLKGLKLKNVGIIIHDHNDFLRMGMNEIIELFPKATIFCLDSVVKNMVSKAVRIEQPFDGTMLPTTPSAILDNGFDLNRDRFICTSRFSGSKYPSDVAESVDGKYPLYFYGVNRAIFDINQYGDLFKTPNVTLVEKATTWTELGIAYLKAKGLLDGSDFKANYDRTQYTILEAWYYGAIPLIKRSWFSKEAVPEETCLELTQKNVKRVWENYEKLDVIRDAGKLMLDNHNPKIVRNDILLSF